MSILKVTGWGFRLPGERRRHREAEAKTRELLAKATRNERGRDVTCYDLREELRARAQERCALKRERDSARAWAVELEQQVTLLSWLLAESEWKRKHPSPLFDRIEHRRGASKRRAS